MVVAEVLAMVFTGASAMAEVISAYNSSKADKKSARSEADHQGYNSIPKHLPFYAGYNHLLPQLPQTSNQIFHYILSVPYYYPHPMSYNHFFVAVPVPTIQQQLNALDLDASGLTRRMALPSQSPTYRLGGTLLLVMEQEAPDLKSNVPAHQKPFQSQSRMKTGRLPGYSMSNARAHWTAFQSRSSMVTLPSTIAVVNWTENAVTMFVKNSYYDQYFRNYHVWNCDAKAFASENRSNHLFSGVIQGSMLHGCNDPFYVVAGDEVSETHSGVKSSNCWSMLGISGKMSRGDLVFVNMMRAAVFGLVECRFFNPALVNVDMRQRDGLEFVHMESHSSKLYCKRDCSFSVFSFSAHEWAAERVLVG